MDVDQYHHLMSQVLVLDQILVLVLVLLLDLAQKFGLVLVQ